MDINLRVIFDVSERLQGLAHSCLDALGAKASKPATPAKRTTKAPEPKPEAAPEPAAEQEPKQEPKQEPTPAPAPEAAPMIAPETDGPIIDPSMEGLLYGLTEGDIRQAIDNTRVRICGPDWEDRKDEPEVARYHRPLNTLFRQIADSIEPGVLKPTKLKNENRRAFIEACNEITIGEDGKLTTPAPF